MGFDGCQKEILGPSDRLYLWRDVVTMQRIHTCRWGIPIPGTDGYILKINYVERHTVFVSVWYIYIKYATIVDNGEIIWYIFVLGCLRHEWKPCTAVVTLQWLRPRSRSKLLVWNLFWSALMVFSYIFTKYKSMYNPGPTIGFIIWINHPKIWILCLLKNH